MPRKSKTKKSKAGKRASVRLVKDLGGGRKIYEVMGKSVKVLHRGKHPKVEVVVGSKRYVTHDIERTVERLLKSGVSPEAIVIYAPDYMAWLLIKYDPKHKVWVGYRYVEHPEVARRKKLDVQSVEVFGPDVKGVAKYLAELRKKHPVYFDEKPALSHMHKTVYEGASNIIKLVEVRALSKKTKVIELTPEIIEKARKYFAMRSRKSQAMDLRRVAKLPPSFEAWLKHPNKYDLPGVDAPPGVMPPTPGSATASPSFYSLVESVVSKYGKPVAVVRGAVFEVKHTGGRKYKLVKLLGFAGTSNSFLVDSKGVAHLIKVPEEVLRKVRRLRGKNVREELEITVLKRVGRR